MDICLKSSVGKRFAAVFDPVTVQSLLSLALIRGGQAVRAGVELALDSRIKSEQMDEDADSYFRAESLMALQADLRNVANNDVAPAAILDSFDVFLAEYKLLVTGSGSERACMEAFMSLCEQLQGA